MRNSGLSRWALFVSLVIVSVGLQRAVILAATPEDCASPKTPFFNCAQLVLGALKKLPDPLDNPTPLFKLAETWDARYQKEYHQFRTAKQLQSAQSDYDKLKEEVGSKINPKDLLKDKLEESLKDKLAKWITNRFKQLAPVVHFLNGNIVRLSSAAVGAFLKPSEIATDWDERRLTNDQVQEEISKRLQPFLRADWKVEFVKQVGPTLERMH